jgi:hypothetical protein
MAAIRLGGGSLLPLECNLPGSQTRRATSSPLFGFAPDGVYPAPSVAGRAVRSYRTFSPLPAYGRRYVFCGTFHQVALSGRYPASRSMESGLSSTGRDTGRGRPLRSGKPAVAICLHLSKRTVSGRNCRRYGSGRPCGYRPLSARGSWRSSHRSFRCAAAPPPA